MARTTTTVTAQALHNNEDIDTPRVIIDGEEWELDSIGECFIVGNYPTLTLLDMVAVSIGWVALTMTRPERDETFSNPSILLWLKQGGKERLALVNPEVEVEVSSIA